jgi:hypothetical protein
MTRRSRMVRVRFGVLIGTACACACSSPPSSNAPLTAGQSLTPPEASACTSLGQEILKASADQAEPVPLVSFFGIAGVSDEEFAKRRQEYEACATPILAAMKEQLFGDEHLAAVEREARTQPDEKALDQQMEEEEASAWRQIDAATLQIAMRCGQQSGSFVRLNQYGGGTITATEVRAKAIYTDRDIIWPENAMPRIWRHRHLADGVYPTQTCASALPAARCVEHHDPIRYDPSFAEVPSIDDATSETQLVCRFIFRSKARGLDLNEIHGKGTLNLTTRMFHFVPD